ncbi:MAG: hypothetical protein VX278_06685, partial [Myxococcota bacterium]|nr:hypothetical protein [Myxococcota bacterium]
MLLTFFSCVQPYYTVRTSFDIPPSEIHFQQEEIALNYRTAVTSPLPKDKERLFKKYRPRKDEIWTLSPAPWPSQMQAMEEIDLRTMIWPSTNAISSPPKELMSSSQPEESIGHIQSGSADLYGPSERFSRDLIILRAQIDSYLQSGSVNWSSSLERADFRPIQKDFSFSPPPYDIEYQTQHKTVIDRFAYTQLSIQLASPPIPVYLNTTLALGDGSPTHRILIHPSSVYIGLSNPVWGEVHTDLPVKAVTVDPTGEMKKA